MKACVGGLCLALVISGIVAGCGSSNSSSATITISPTSATVLLGTSLQFIPNETGSSNGITWSVNGIADGNATVGTISSTGLYTAPAARPTLGTGVSVPVVFAMANSSIPGSGSIGSVIELQSGFNLANFAAGNTINITGNSVAGWNGSFIIVAAATLPNGNFGVQIVALPGPPATGLGGTATATPNITITAQVQQTNAVASATVNLDSGIRVSIARPTCTIGANETLDFTKLVTVSGISNVTVSGTSNQQVTWSLTSGIGTIDPNSGIYTAPSTTGTATITATSVADATETASATITVVTAADPTLTSMSPTTGALGAAFQQIFLSGSSFICTTGVFVNGTPLPAGNIFSLSSTSLLVILPDTVLSTPPTSGNTTTLTFTVQRQGGAQQSCSTPCQLVLSPVRPAVVAVTPDSIQPGNGKFNVTLDGGYFGTSSTNNTGGFQGSPAVGLQFAGSPISSFQFSPDPRRLSFTLSASDVAVPGLYPIAVSNIVAGSANGSMTVVNLAAQPTTVPTQIGSAQPVGSNPTSVSVNMAMGTAVVANQGSNDVTILSLGAPTAPSISPPPPSLCSGSLGTVNGPGCGTAAPVSVAVDNLRNLALVCNAATVTPTLAVVNLGVPSVTALISFPSADSNGNAFFLIPRAVAINPVSGRALVAFTTLSGTNGSNVGAILDMNQLQNLAPGSYTLATLPAGAVPGIVNINNGPNPHIAVSARLNWALSTPGGAGSLSIVDLGRQVTNGITAISRTTNVVAATTSTTPALQVGQPVLVTGIADASFDGIFSVTAVSNGGFQYADMGANVGSTAVSAMAAYATPVATLATNLNVRGVSINDETAKALLVDPTNAVPAFVFNIVDQSSQLVNNLPTCCNTNNVATAMNPLTNVGVIVNQSSNQGFLVDPVTPTAIPFSPPGSPPPTFTTGASPVDVAVDPAANTALVVNQKDNTVSLFSLGTANQQLRSGAPQIVQASFAPTTAPTQTSSRIVITSSLSSPATANSQNQTVTLIGTFPSGSVPRLDGDASPFSGISISANGRVMTATLSGNVLATNGPRVYALDVLNTSTGISNAASLQVIQAVNLVTGTGSGPGNCGNPSPQGVAIDATHEVALVTEPGCNDVALVPLPNSATVINTPELPVGTNPQGVAVYPQAGLAVVANAGSNDVSIVEVVKNGGNDDVATTFGTDPLPDGVAVNPGTGKAVVTANGASLVDTFPVSTTSQTPTTIGVQQGPSGVAIDPKGEIAVVANSTSNTASIVNLSSNTTTNTNALLSFPQGVAFDPISDNFLITSSARNEVTMLNPNNISPQTFRVGIDPSSIAYNFESGTLATANNLSGTMTIVDFIDQTVRGVFSLPSSTQFAVDIHPQTNLAVVADPKDNQLLLVPLPH